MVVVPSTKRKMGMRERVIWREREIAKGERERERSGEGEGYAAEAVAGIVTLGPRLYTLS